MNNFAKNSAYVLFLVVVLVVGTGMGLLTQYLAHAPQSNTQEHGRYKIVKYEMAGRTCYRLNLYDAREENWYCIDIDEAKKERLTMIGSLTNEVNFTGEYVYKYGVITLFSDQDRLTAIASLEMDNVHANEESISRLQAAGHRPLFLMERMGAN